MNYTQMLRGLNCLKWLAIVLGALYAFIVVVAASNNAFAFVHAHHPTTKHGFIPLPALLGVAGFVASGIASVLARSLSAENEAHLPVVWTLPRSRSRYAVSVFSTDCAFALAAFGITFAWLIAIIATFDVWNLVVVTPDAGAQLARYLAMPIAIYGLLVAVTAWAAKAGRALTGWTWLALFVVGALGAADVFPPPWHTIFVALNLINPLAYVSYHATMGSGSVSLIAGPDQTWFTALSLTTDVLALVAIGLAGLIAGTAEWNRVEA